MSEHMSLLVCWACAATAETLEPGWALRADNGVAACPEHTAYMPPHPKGLDHAYIELDSPLARELELTVRGRSTT